MSGEEELAELLHTAARASGDAHPDTGALLARAHRARRHQRMAGAGAAVVLVLLGAAALPAVFDEKPKTVDLASGGSGDGAGTAGGSLPAEPTTTIDPSFRCPVLACGPTAAPALGPTTTFAPTPAPPPTRVPAPGPVPTSAPGMMPPSSIGPQTPTSAVPAGAPRVVSATGNAAAGRVTVRFDRPVVAGTSPASSCCPAGYLAAMSLVVYGADATCGVPAGNAHEYLAGSGTDTITTDASSLVAGTTYITVAPGFVMSAKDGTENAPTGCTPILVTG